MLFNVFPNVKSIDPKTEAKFILIPDAWNDHNFMTTYNLGFLSLSKTYIPIGSVRIGQKGLIARTLKDDKIVETGRPKIVNEFDTLSDDFFSLSSQENYYETLANFHTVDEKDSVLLGLRDCAYNLDILSENLNESVMKLSLLRLLTIDHVFGRMHRLAHGNAELTDFYFDYIFPLRNSNNIVRMDFQVIPNSFPPTNVHVLIGSNGVGKTTCLSDFIHSFVNPTNLDRRDSFLSHSEIFSRVVSVSFSAFDDFIPPLGDINESENDESSNYKYVGLKNKDGKSLKSLDALAYDFLNSVKQCRIGSRRMRWADSLSMLESDPFFKNSGISKWCQSEKDEQKIMTFFKRLSSGHKIVLLTVSKLVEFVDEKTLVIIDEPEAHLHPPLLSSLVRCISTLMSKRNGVAIVATHSPVVLQEVPRSCTWIMRREGDRVDVDRPAIETFGENVGVLTREVFGFQITKSGFLKLIEERINRGESSEDIFRESNMELGSEAKAYAVGLSSIKNKKIW